MKYCYDCGTKLEKRYLRNEGVIPYCSSCQKYIFPIFSTACSMIVFNKAKDKILLIKQYQRDAFVLVAGYVNIGENAENTVIREVKEETGLNVIELTFNLSEYFSRSNTLMLNFSCVVDSEDFVLNEEVDEAKWLTVKEAYENIMPSSLAEKFLKHYIKQNNIVF